MPFINGKYFPPITRNPATVCSELVRLADALRYCSPDTDGDRYETLRDLANELDEAIREWETVFYTP